MVFSLRAPYSRVVDKFSMDSELKIDPSTESLRQAILEFAKRQNNDVKEEWFDLLRQRFGDDYDGEYMPQPLVVEQQQTLDLPWTQETSTEGQTPTETSKISLGNFVEQVVCQKYEVSVMDFSKENPTKELQVDDSSLLKQNHRRLELVDVRTQNKASKVNRRRRISDSLVEGEVLSVRKISVKRRYHRARKKKPWGERLVNHKAESVQGTRSMVDTGCEEEVLIAGSRMSGNGRVTMGWNRLEELSLENDDERCQRSSHVGDKTKQSFDPGGLQCVKLSKVLVLDDDIAVQKDLSGLGSVDLKSSGNGDVETCEEAKVISGRDLSTTLEKDLEILIELDDIFWDANTETNKEKMKEDIDSSIQTYHLMSPRGFTHASPTLFNSGTPKAQLSSCFLICIKDDSIEGKYETLKVCVVINKSSGGMGVSVHSIPATGCFIHGIYGAYNGIVPRLREFKDTAHYVDQGGDGDRDNKIMVLTSGSQKPVDELSQDDIGIRKRRIANVLEPGETVMQALRRLKGNSNSRKEKMASETKLIFDQLTEDANNLMQNGDYNVYHEEQEVFQLEVEEYERLARARGNGNADTKSCDMFGDDEDTSGALQSDYVFDESSGTKPGKLSKDIVKVEKWRIVKSILCNERSSRSHWMIILDVPTVGRRLMLVDMVGSENIDQVGQNEFEAKMQIAKINEGYIALKRLVESIANGDSYLPFIDNKLTMFLQDSFEDDTKAEKDSLSEYVGSVMLIILAWEELWFMYSKANGGGKTLLMVRDTLELLPGASWFTLSFGGSSLQFNNKNQYKGEMKNEVTLQSAIDDVAERILLPESSISQLENVFRHFFTYKVWHRQRPPKLCVTTDYFLKSGLHILPWIVSIVLVMVVVGKTSESRSVDKFDQDKTIGKAKTSRELGRSSKIKEKGQVCFVGNGGTSIEGYQNFENQKRPGFNSGLYRIAWIVWVWDPGESDSCRADWFTRVNNGDGMSLLGYLAVQGIRWKTCCKLRGIRLKVTITISHGFEKTSDAKKGGRHGEEHSIVPQQKSEHGQMRIKESEADFEEYKRMCFSHLKIEESAHDQIKLMRFLVYEFFHFLRPPEQLQSQMDSWSNKTIFQP